MSAHTPGIYFGMPEAEYHSVLALSKSGIKNMQVSALDFWVRSPLNPDFERVTSDAMENGTAYHKRIVEGPAAFRLAYAPALDREDYPDALVTAEDIRDELRARGMKVGGNKATLIERLSERDPDIEIWERIEEGYLQEHAGQTIIPHWQYNQIEIAAAMIEKHPELHKCFTGGQAEVSIFWVDEATGCPMKARVDYLKARAVIDYKTFSNTWAKPINRAIASAMASGKYHIDAAVYMAAADEIAGLVDSGLVHDGHDERWLRQVAGANDRQFVFVFQQMGPAPVARGKVLPKLLTYDVGVVSMREAQRKFVACMEKYGSDPWIDDAPIETFDDTEFPAWIGEA